MTVCLVAEQGARYLRTITRESEDSLVFFLLTPAELRSRTWPAAELYILPVKFYLELPRENRPAPAFAYGPVCLLAEALAAGVLDYLCEPWEAAELEARALGRLSPLIPLGDCLLDPAHRRLCHDTAWVLLGEKEFRALRLFALAPDGVLTRPALVYALWGTQRRSSRSPDVLISAIRAKLRFLGVSERLRIGSIRGVGYRLEW